MSTFRISLRNLSQRLTAEDVEGMKFICIGTLPESVLEGIHDSLGLFQALEERGKIGQNNVELLEELLKGIGRGNLASVLKQTGQNNPFLPQPPPPVHAGRSHTLDYRTILNKVAESLTEQDVRQIIYLFPSLNNEQSHEALRRDPRQLVVHMERRTIISPGNLERLKWALNEIGRKDLSVFIDGTDVFKHNFTARHDPLASLNHRGQDPQLYLGGVVARSVSQEPNQGYTALHHFGHQHHPPYGEQLGRNRREDDMRFPEERPVEQNIPYPRAQISEETQRWEQHYPGYHQHGDVSGHPPLPRQQPNEALRGGERRKGPKVVNPPKASYSEEYMRQIRQLTRNSEELREDRNRFPLNPPQPSPSYPMNCKPHGTAVIIAVDEIMVSPGLAPPTPPPRKALSVDKASLEATFQYLGYSVMIYANLSSSEMKRVMRRFADVDHSHDDSFIFCYLGCGTESGVYCNDGEILSFQEISSPLKESPTLYGKPKMFFFQMSQGATLDRGSVLPHQSTVVDARRQVIPSEADFLFAYSSVRGYCAHNDIRRGGSFYITMLTDVLTERANTQDLTSMLTEVSNKMAEVEVAMVNGQVVMQIQEVVSRLTKQVWFRSP